MTPQEQEIRQRWIEQGGRCQGMNSQGLQCKNPCSGMGSDICGNNDFYDVEFVLGITDRCYCHKLDKLLTKVSNPDCSQIAITDLAELLTSKGF